MKNELKDLAEHDDAIFDRALEFKVTKQMLEDLVPFYQQGKPRLVMQRDYRNKVRWQLSNPPSPAKSSTSLDRRDSLSRNKSSPL